MHILSTMHRLLACMTCTVKEVHFHTLYHAVDRVWRKPDVKSEKRNKTRNITKNPKTVPPLRFYFYFWKVLKKIFHFWRRRFIFGLLIAGDCNHSAASNRIGPLLLWGWRCKRMSWLKLKARSVTPEHSDTERETVLWGWIFELLTAGEKKRDQELTLERMRCRVSSLLSSSNLSEIIKYLRVWCQIIFIYLFFPHFFFYTTTQSCI